MRFLRTCCCGCTLRTGTIIIGSLSLIASAASMILMIAVIPLIQQQGNAADGVLKYETKYTTSKFSDDADSGYFIKTDIEIQTQSPNDLMDVSSNRNEINHRIIMTRTYDMKIIITYMVGSSISLIASILMLVGAAKGYMWLLLPWIAYMSLSIIVGIVSSIYQLVTLSYYGASGGSVFLGAVVIAGVIGLYFYLLMVVISHFEELKKSKREENSNLGKIYLAPNPWMTSNANILPNLPEKEGA